MKKSHLDIEILLENYNTLKVNVENMKLELKEIENESGLRAITYEQECVSKTNKITSITEETAIKNIEYSDLLKRRLDITESKLKRIDNALNQLDDLEREIVVRRDIEREPWYTITCDMAWSPRTVSRMRRKALDKLVVCMYGMTQIWGMQNESAYC